MEWGGFIHRNRVPENERSPDAGWSTGMEVKTEGGRQGIGGRKADEGGRGPGSTSGQARDGSPQREREPGLHPSWASSRVLRPHGVLYSEEDSSRSWIQAD